MELMNLEEINNIEDYGLRTIRLKYWNLRHKAFLDERHISDSELDIVWEKLKEDEEKEISLYLKKQEDNPND